MKRHSDEDFEDVRPASEPASASKVNVSWRMMLLVASILLVGAVVGHGLLTDAGTSERLLPCGEAASCASCPSGVKCSAEQPGQAGEQGVCTKASAADGCCDKQVGCPFVEEARCPDQPSCVEKATGLSQE
ncbi:MAG: hypothetical protein JSU70_16100 [Phycisphaerales bacterium]|nr:MAG: hypothetical protein JSU70_16100 [Phycisphaerales bacterium]